MAAFQSWGARGGPPLSPPTEHFSRFSLLLCLAFPAALAFHPLRAVAGRGVRGSPLSYTLATAIIEPLSTRQARFSSPKPLFNCSFYALHIWPKHLWMPGRWVTFKVERPGGRQEMPLPAPPAWYGLSHPAGRWHVHSQGPRLFCCARLSLSFLPESPSGRWSMLIIACIWTRRGKGGFTGVTDKGCKREEPKEKEEKLLPNITPRMPFPHRATLQGIMRFSRQPTLQH